MPAQPTAAEGIATAATAIYRAFSAQKVGTVPNVQSPIPNLQSLSSGARAMSGRLLPDPAVAELSSSLPQSPRGAAPIRAVAEPAAGGRAGRSARRLAPLDEKLARIAALLEDLKKGSAGAAAGSPAVAEPSKPAVDEQARKAAEAALGQVADLRAESEKNLRDLKSDAAKTAEAVGGLTTAVEKIKNSVDENGTVSERFHARVDKVKAELEEKLGHQASQHEVRIAYLKDLIQDKLGDGGMMKILIVAAVAAVVVFLLVKHKAESGTSAQGDTLAEKIGDKIQLALSGAAAAHPALVPVAAGATALDAVIHDLQAKARRTTRPCSNLP